MHTHARTYTHTHTHTHMCNGLWYVVSLLFFHYLSLASYRVYYIQPMLVGGDNTESVSNSNNQIIGLNYILNN